MIKKLLNKKMKFLKNQQGLTLIELLVVIVILGIIAAIGIPMVMGNSEKAQINANKQSQSVLQDAVNRFMTLNNGVAPTTDAQLTTKGAVLGTTTVEGGPFIEAIPKCADQPTTSLTYTGGKAVIPAACKQ